MVTTLTLIGICLLVSFLFAEAFNRVKLPEVIGQIFAGIFLGLPFFAIIFTADALRDIELLSDMGIIFLLLLAGMELNLPKLKEVKKEAILVALLGAGIPFILGFALAQTLGYSLITSIILGAALSITAEGTTLKLLIDMNVLRSKIGTIILGAGLIDDFLGISFLSVVIVTVHQKYENLLFLPIELVAFIAIAYLTYKIIPKMLKIIRKEHSRVSTFSSIIIIGLIIAILSQSLSLGPIIGAFVAGIVIQLSHLMKREENMVIEELKVMTFSLIIPFFFIYIGLQFNFRSIIDNFWIVLLILFIATIGKLIGAMAATAFTSLSLKQGYLIGWGMNSRGAVELVIAQIAREAGLIPIEIYSAIVVVAVITTIIFPIYLKRIHTTDPKIMNY